MRGKMAGRSEPAQRRRNAGRPVAAITGGGTGIGVEIGRRLAREGYDLAIASRSREHLSTGRRALQRAGAEVLAVPTDVRDPAQVDAWFSAIRGRFGRLDLLVNNAAGNFSAPAERISPNGWRAVVGIVLDGTFYCCRAAFPMLRANRPASIVNIVASYAWMAGPGTAHSAAAKAGVVALTRTLAVEWARFGIRVNAVAPGPVHTPGTDRQLWTSRRLVRAVTATVPLGRFGTVQEVAAAVWFLARPASAYVTGEVLTVDGGQWLGRGVMDLRTHARSGPRGAGRSVPRATRRKP